MERYLEIGYTLQRNDGGKYVITEMIGRGSSCAVYRAEHYAADSIRTEHLLKEYNPRAVSITRTNDGTMCVSPEEQDAFDTGLERFQSGHESQLDLRQTDELRNSTSNIQNIFDANGTRYIDMTLFTGSTYSDIHEQSLYDLCKRMKAVTQVVGNYHKAGLLHLDIKPDNIFALPETCELVMLFDFDSVVEKNCIERYTGLSYTKTWAAPEQVIPTYRKKICEATDLYAIGEMMFWQIFDRHSTAEEHRSFFAYQFDTEADIFKNTNPKVFGLLSDLLHHTIATSVANRYQSAEELIAALDELITLSDPKEAYLVSTNVTAEEYFIGRDTELRQIHEMLSVDNVLYLCGMGGIGKSELARNYVKQYRKDYDTVFFATYMGSWSMLLSDDYRIQIANFHSYEGEKPEDYCARKLRKLKELCDERTLFVIDNVNEDEYDESENECFKQIMELPCRFLFTSRLHEWSNPMLDIGVLSDHADLVALFEKWCHIKDDEQKNAVNAIIDYVECHTLTLELIAKQTKAGFSTPAKMLAKLQEHGMRDSGKEKIRSDKDLTVTEKRAFEHICDLYDMAALTDGEKYVMANMALIPATGIEATLFMEWCELEDANDINSLIDKKGWIDRDEEIIRLHPLLSEILLYKVVVLSKGNSSELFTRFFQNISKKADAKSFLGMQGAQRIWFMNACVSIAKKIIDYKISTDAAVRFFVSDIWVDGMPGMIQNGLTLSKKYYDYALEFYRTDPEKYAIEIVDTLGHIGVYYSYLCDFPAAKEHLEKALSIITDKHIDNPKSIIAIYCDMGYLFSEDADFSQSIVFYKKAISIAEEHTMTAELPILYNNLARDYQDMDLFDDAVVTYSKGIEIQIQQCGEIHSDTALLYRGLAGLYMDTEHYELAQQYCKKALWISLSLDSNSTDTADSYYDLALSSLYLERFADAEQYLTKSIDIRKFILGNDNQKTANANMLLGHIMGKQNQYDKATDYIDEALSIIERIHTSKDGLSASYNSAGKFFYGCGNYARSEEYLTKALSIREEIYGEHHSDTALSYFALGLLHKRQAKSDSVELMNKGYRIYKNIMGENNPTALDMQSQIDDC